MRTRRRLRRGRTRDYEGHRQSESASSNSLLQVRRLSSGALRGEVAGHLMAWGDLLQDRSLGRLREIHTLLISRAMWTPRVEAAAARRVSQIGRRSRDSRQPGPRPAQWRKGSQETLRIRMLR